MSASNTLAEAVIAAALARISGLDPTRTPDMLALGSALLDIQAALPGRAFEPWRRERLPRFSRRSVSNFMQAARRFGANPAAIAHLGPTAVVRLAAKSVPEAERDALIDRASKGDDLVAAEIVIRAREGRVRDAAKADAAARGRDRKATVRAWQREHGRDASSDSVRIAATRRAARKLAPVDAPDWLRSTVRVCDAQELRDMILEAWAQRDLETQVMAAPAPKADRPAGSQGLRLQKRESPSS